MERDRVKKYGGLPRKSNNMLEQDEERGNDTGKKVCHNNGEERFFRVELVPGTKYTKTAQATLYDHIL